MFATQTRKSRAFSLIELVIVVVIIGIIAAIAIPRMSRGAAGASDSAVAANLAVLRNAIDLFQTEHGGTYPSGTSTEITDLLTKYSNEAGTSSGAKSATLIYGPYLRAVPALPVGANKGKNTFSVASAAGDTFSSSVGTGWWYNPFTGEVRANTAAGEQDARGTLYSAY